MSTPSFPWLARMPGSSSSGSKQKLSSYAGTKGGGFTGTACTQHAGRNMCLKGTALLPLLLLLLLLLLLENKKRKTT